MEPGRGRNCCLLCNRKCLPSRETAPSAAGLGATLPWPRSRVSHHQPLLLPGQSHGTCPAEIDVLPWHLQGSWPHTSTCVNPAQEALDGSLTMPASRSNRSPEANLELRTVRIKIITRTVLWGSLKHEFGCPHLCSRGPHTERRLEWLLSANPCPPWANPLVVNVHIGPFPKFKLPSDSNNHRSFLTWHTDALALYPTLLCIDPWVMFIFVLQPSHNPVLISHNLWTEL